MRKTIIAVFAASTLALGVTACSSDDANDAVDSVENAGENAGESLDEGLNDAGDAIGDAAADATDAVGDAANDAESELEEAGDELDSELDEAGDDMDNAMSDDEMKMVPGASGEVAIPAAIADKYEELEGSEGYLGQAQGEAQPVEGGQMVPFAGGVIVSNNDGDAYAVQGMILDKYNELGGPDGELGLPIEDEEEVDGGWVSKFENGEIRYVNGEYEVNM